MHRYAIGLAATAVLNDPPRRRATKGGDIGALLSRRASGQVCEVVHAQAGRYQGLKPMAIDLGPVGAFNDFGGCRAQIGDWIERGQGMKWLPRGGLIGCLKRRRIRERNCAIQTALSCWATAQVYLEEWAIFGIIGASKPGIDTLGGNGMRVHHSVIVVACFSHLWLAICRDSSAGDLRPYPLPPAARAGI